MSNSWEITQISSFTRVKHLQSSIEKRLQFDLSFHSKMAFFS